MKKFLAALLILTLCLTAFVACTPADDSTGSTGITNSTVSGNSTSSAPTGPSLPDESQIITIAQALELCGEDGNITEERYYIRATIESITNATYGAMVITDATGSISVYGTYNEDGSIPYSEMTEKPYKGDEVLLHCILQNYKGTKEIKNARLIAFEHKEPDVDQTAYTEMSISQAREAAAGTLVKVDGVVAQITYANGHIPSGIFLVDETNAILIHDGDLAQRVQIGNQITVLASKTYWILGTEADNASKYGYKGSCQLENVILLDNDNRTDKSFDHAWIPTSTVKDILETPVSENITTTIFKVNALVKKVDGTGFVNYYFFDLDGETGTYTYTQCNGSDFSWLDQFDGKICTAYLSAINAKSTSTDCFFRLQPIQVLDEGFQFDRNNTAEHIVKYYGMDQFLGEYSGDPMLELITSVSSDLLGFQDAKLSYTSSNTSVINFKEADGKLYMRGIMPGTATITVTGSYNGKTFSQTMDITIGGTVTVDSMNIQQVVSSAAGTSVTVKGIVGPSLVNKNGFYLIDETGVLAIYMDEAEMETLKMGHEVVLEGVRDYHKKDSSSCVGQSFLKDPKIVTNNYGNHEYSTASFIQGKTLADIAALSVMEDHSTSVYVVKATVELSGNNYYTNIQLSSNGTTLRLYCSSANQYEFLKQFEGQEITLELAPCNWNDKNYYTGCVLAVITESGKVYNTLNFK